MQHQSTLPLHYTKWWAVQIVLLTGSLSLFVRVQHSLYDYMSCSERNTGTKKRMKVLLREPGCPASVTNTVKESLQALLCIACTLLADSHISKTAPRPFIKICTWMPPAGGLHTMPIKLCGNHLTQANYFPALDLICVNKHSLGNTVKVLLVLLDEK